MGPVQADRGFAAVVLTADLAVAELAVVDLEHTRLGLAEFIDLGPIDQPNGGGVALELGCARQVGDIGTGALCIGGVAA